MSLMGGLVENPADRPVVAPKRTVLREWIVRHAWKLAVGFSAAVWLIVAAIVFFR